MSLTSSWAQVPWAQSAVMWFYLLLPVAVAGLAVVRTVRGGSRRPLKDFFLLTLSGTVLGTALTVVYAVGTDGRPPVGQILVTSYFCCAVICLLRAFSWLLQQGLERLLRARVRVRHKPADGGEEEVVVLVRRGRLALARAGRVILLIALGLPYVMAVFMVYRPKVNGPDPMEQFRWQFETVRFDALDGVPVEAWWVPAQGAAPAGGNDPPTQNPGTKTVIFCHGLGAGKSNQIFAVHDLVTHGYNVLAIDLRAHGGSGGQLTSFGDLERYDVLGAVRWLRENRPGQSRHVYGLGVSMGAAALLAAAADEGPEGQAIEAVAVCSTYDRFDNLARSISAAYFGRHFPPMAWLAENVGVPVAALHVGRDLTAFAPADAAYELGPRMLLVVHGVNDEIISFDHGQDLYRSAWPREHHWVWPDERKGVKADHNSVLTDTAVARRIRAFFDRAAMVI